MIYILSSQNMRATSHGGIRTLADLLLKLNTRIIHIKNETIIQTLVSISAIKKADWGILIGYSDKVVFFSLVNVLFRRHQYIYIPCFHPWYAMNNRLFAWVYERTFLVILLRSRRVLCLSEYERNYLTNLYPSGTYDVINLPSRFTYDPNKGSGRKNIIFVGRDDSNKNLDGFIQICDEIERDFSEGLNFIIISDTKRLLPVRFKIYKDMTNEEVQVLYCSSLAIVVPSRWESLSLVGVEAISCGCKLICTGGVTLGTKSSIYPSLIMDLDRSDFSVGEFLRHPVNDVELSDFQTLHSYDHFLEQITGDLRDVFINQ